MRAPELDLEFPVFDDTAFPAPELTLTEWLEWLDWAKREFVSAEHLEQWINDPERRAVEVPFTL